MWFWNLIASGLEILAALFVVAIGLGVLVALIFFVVDRLQTKDAVRRNYPVIGRFRHLFSELGEFFRQYFFAMDREEMPFNRAQRNWIGRASSGEGNTIAFGSTRNVAVTGTPIFVNAPFPPLDQDFAATEALRIGPHCRAPYDAPSFFNISGMSFGALSRPAVKALSRGASEA
ncbi:MAG: FMN-binding glutamate synthase family protein, partial [Pseudomonadota bacterium]